MAKKPEGENMKTKTFLLGLVAAISLSVMASAPLFAGVPGSACNDGNACTIKDVFDRMGKVCAGKPKTPPPTQLGPCQQYGACDPKTGIFAVVIKPAGSACNDNNACTTNDQCSGTTCAGIAAVVDDGDPFTVDSCDPAIGVVHAPQAASPALLKQVSEIKMYDPLYSANVSSIIVCGSNMTQVKIKDPMSNNIDNHYDIYDCNSDGIIDVVAQFDIKMMLKGIYPLLLDKSTYAKFVPYLQESLEFTNGKLSNFASVDGFLFLNVEGPSSAQAIGPCNGTDYKINFTFNGMEKVTLKCNYKSDGGLCTLHEFEIYTEPVVGFYAKGIFSKSIPAGYLESANGILLDMIGKVPDENFVKCSTPQPLIIDFE